MELFSDDFIDSEQVLEFGNDFVSVRYLEFFYLWFFWFKFLVWWENVYFLF